MLECLKRSAICSDLRCHFLPTQKRNFQSSHAGSSLCNNQEIQDISWLCVWDHGLCLPSILHIRRGSTRRDDRRSSRRHLPQL